MNDRAFIVFYVQEAQHRRFYLIECHPLDPDIQEKIVLHDPSINLIRKHIQRKHPNAVVTKDPKLMGEHPEGRVIYEIWFSDKAFMERVKHAPEPSAQSTDPIPTS